MRMLWMSLLVVGCADDPGWVSGEEFASAAFMRWVEEDDTETDGLVLTLSSTDDACLSVVELVKNAGETPEEWAGSFQSAYGDDGRLAIIAMNPGERYAAAGAKLDLAGSGAIGVESAELYLPGAQGEVAAATASFEIAAHTDERLEGSLAATFPGADLAEVSVDLGAPVCNEWLDALHGR